MRQGILSIVMLALLLNVGMGCQGESGSSPSLNQTPISKPSPGTNNNSPKALTEQEKEKISQTITSMINGYVFFNAYAFNETNLCDVFAENVKSMGILDGSKTTPGVTSSIVSQHCDQEPISFTGVVQYKLSFQHVVIEKDADYLHDGSISIEYTIKPNQAEAAFIESDLKIDGRAYDFTAAQAGLYDKATQKETPHCGGTVTVDGHSCQVADDCMSCQF